MELFGFRLGLDECFSGGIEGLAEVGEGVFLFVKGFGKVFYGGVEGLEGGLGFGEVSVGKR